MCWYQGSEASLQRCRWLQLSSTDQVIFSDYIAWASLVTVWTTLPSPRLSSICCRLVSSKRRWLQDRAEVALHSYRTLKWSSSTSRGPTCYLFGASYSLEPSCTQATHKARLSNRVGPSWTLDYACRSLISRYVSRLESRCARRCSDSSLSRANWDSCPFGGRQIFCVSLGAHGDRDRIEF